MTAAELVAFLQGFPPDTLVLVKGYEGGYDDIADLKQLSVVHIGKTGPFGPLWGAYDDALPDDKAQITAIVLKG